jgi:hypothetical protein
MKNHTIDTITNNEIQGFIEQKTTESDILLLATIDAILLLDKEINEPIENKQYKTIASITINMIEIKRQQELKLNKINNFKKILEGNIVSHFSIVDEYIEKLNIMVTTSHDNYRKKHMLLERQLEILKGDMSPSLILLCIVSIVAIIFACIYETVIPQINLPVLKTN